MLPLRDHLLRTMAAVPPASRVLVLTGGLENPAEPLAQLGFAVCRSPAAEVGTHADAQFDWVVAVLERADPEVLREVRRVLKPGGWVYAAVPAVEAEAERHPPGEDLSAEEKVGARMAAARLAEAQPAQRAEARGRALVQAIYRRVEPGTPV